MASFLSHAIEAIYGIISFIQVEVSLWGYKS